MEKQFLPILDFKVLILKSGTIFGGCNNSLEDQGFETHFTWKIILIGCLRQRMIADDSFRRTKWKRYSVMQMEERIVISGLPHFGFCWI